MWDHRFWFDGARHSTAVWPSQVPTSWPSGTSVGEAFVWEGMRHRSQPAAATHPECNFWSAMHMQGEMRGHAAKHAEGDAAKHPEGRCRMCGKEGREVSQST